MFPSTTIRVEAEEALAIPLHVGANADDDSDGCETTGVLVSASSELMMCPGSRDWSNGEHCCLGFSDSNKLACHRPTVSASLDRCRTTTRFLSASAWEEIVTVQAIGDRHMTNVTFEKVEMLMTGYPTRICAGTSCNGR